MGTSPGTMKKGASPVQMILLAILSCLVLGAATMIVFNELELLSPTRSEKMVYDWHRENSADDGE